MKSFSKLYSLPETLPTDLDERNRILREFLTACNLQKLSSKALAFLNSPITAEEIGEDLKDLPQGKAPGPEGLTYLYFRTLSDLLVPKMTTL